MEGVRTIAFLHDTLNGDEPLIKERGEFGRILPLDMTDLSTTNVLHLNRIRIVLIARLPDEPYFLSGADEPYFALIWCPLLPRSGSAHLYNIASLQRAPLSCNKVHPAHRRH